jgi:glycosyltransferase involved in cell wall biosynthesis
LDGFFVWEHPNFHPWFSIFWIALLWCAAMQNPDVSIVIPIYNEEGILTASVAGLREALADMGIRYELILSENGSKDATVEIATRLAERYPEVRLIRSPIPDYGYALRLGILGARGRVVICDEIDLCDDDFYRRALAEIEAGADFVVGSKVLDRSLDKRPAYRKFATLVINFLLRVFVGFEGTDTHGLKAFKRASVISVVERCVVNKDLFASELVIRAMRMKLSVIEIPVQVIEKRAPSVHLFRRVPNVLKGIARLTWHIRVVNR